MNRFRVRLDNGDTVEVVAARFDIWRDGSLAFEAYAKDGVCTYTVLCYAPGVWRSFRQESPES